MFPCLLHGVWVRPCITLALSWRGLSSPGLRLCSLLPVLPVLLGSHMRPGVTQLRSLCPCWPLWTCSCSLGTHQFDVAVKCTSIGVTWRVPSGYLWAKNLVSVSETFLFIRWDNNNTFHHKVDAIIKDENAGKTLNLVPCSL